MLPIEQRQVIELMYFRGLSRAEVSRVLGIEPRAISAACVRGLRQLRGGGPVTPQT